MEFAWADHEALVAAVRRLEARSLAGRLAALAGKPVGLVQRALPATASAAVAVVTKRALERALNVALFSLRNPSVGGGRKLHSGLACTSGAIGGAFGLAALAIELPISTTIMLRAIAAVARQEGEDLSDPRTGLACLEVFALGGPKPDEAGVEADYFAVRAMLARGLVEITDFAVDKGALREGAPLLVRFMTQIASRFGIVVSQKIAAQAVAVVGAVGGAAINLAFVKHFQGVARGHFTVRRLERVYGADVVRAEYERLRSAPAAATRSEPSDGRGAAIPAVRKLLPVRRGLEPDGSRARPTGADRSAQRRSILGSGATGVWSALRSGTPGSPPDRSQ
jgi:EcsC protein family